MNALSSVSLYSFINTSQSELQTTVIFDNYTPIRRLLATIYYLPISTRKLLLDACRIQQPIRTNLVLAASAKALKDLGSSYTVGFNKHGKIRYSEFFLDDIIKMFDHIYHNPILCCLLSYFVRSESTKHRQEFLDQIDILINKEITASQLGEREQQLNYRCLFTDEKFDGIHEEISRFPEKTTQMWKNHLRSAMFTFRSESFILFPYFNARKNIGYSTQESLGVYLQGEPIDTHSLTSLDLLRTYAQHGMQVRGPLELRYAWKFNELKPRVYYCLGGTAYWDGLYIKAVANFLVEAFPSTNPFSRFEIRRLGPLQDSELLVLYDYSSFTTTLAELKYLLTHLSWAFTGVDVQVLDVHLGLLTVDLGELLRDYNESVNQNQEYDISRLFGVVDSICRQTRNGSLGVQGNIVFSTLTHGISLSGFTDSPDSDSCVGDDAGLKVHLLLLGLFGVIAQKLGVLNPDKVTKIPVPDINDFQATQRNGFKYLKRPINVLPMGEIDTGFLDFFPNFAPYLFPNGDGIHTTNPESDERTLSSICSQWGKFLHMMNMTPYVHDQIEDDLQIILMSIQKVYLTAGIPFEGMIPGLSTFYNRSTKLPEVLNFYCPPCDTPDVFYSDWLYILLSRFAGVKFRAPRRIGGVLPPRRDLYPGAVYYGTHDSLTLLMCGLKFFGEEKVMEEITFDEAYVEKEERLFKSGSNNPDNCIYEFTVHDLPTYFVDVVDVLYPEQREVVRFQAAALEISTMYGSDD